MYQLNEGWDEPTVPDGDFEADEQCESVDKETYKLRRLASAIAEIHKFQWAEDAGQSQCDRAVAYFEQQLMENTGLD